MNKLYYHPAMFFKKISRERVLCLLCSHYCKIEKGDYGICNLRKNIEGELFTITWGKLEAFAIDPIEKKPLYHFKPGTRVLSFGTPGCNFSCKNCQNSNLSQQFYKSRSFALSPTVRVERFFEICSKYNFDGIAYTYSEPTIFFEYARDIILYSKEIPKYKNLFHLFVTNGFFTPQVLDLILKENLLQAMNIDLKFLNNKMYKEIAGGKLEPVLENIKAIYKSKKIALEITNLVIRDLNDKDEDFEKISQFIAGISCDIPLHFSRFYPTYQMQNAKATDLNALIKAKEIAQKNGLKYVYIGNTNLDNASNTYCPYCKELLIERTYNSLNCKIIDAEKAVCPNCKKSLEISL